MHLHPGISTGAKLRNPDVVDAQVGVNSKILDQLLKVSITIYVTIAYIDGSQSVPIVI